MENELNLAENGVQDFTGSPNSANMTESNNEKPNIPLREAILAWITFVLGFVFTHYAIRYMGGIWGGIFWSSYGIVGAVYVKNKKLNTSKAQLILFITAEIFSLTPFFCANRFINFLAASFVFLMFFYLLITLSSAELFGRHFITNILQSVFVRPFLSFVNELICISSVFRGKKRANNILFVLLGLICAVPLTIVVAFLLMSSDDIFENFMLNFRDYLPKISFRIVPEIFFAVPISMYLFGAFASAEKPAPAERMGEPDYRGLPPIVGYVAVSPICVFYLFYIGIQISRIFGETLSSNSSYSDFARRGFFELFVIAVINLAVIIILQTFTKRLSGDIRPAALRVYTVLLCVSTLGIIATALVKMIMYINRLGMTLLRVYTSWFMILLALIFIVVIIMQFKDFGFWKAIFVSFAVMFGILCFGDIDGQIARYNITAYQNGALKEVDIGEFYELGFSAIEPAVRLKQSGYPSEKLDMYLDSIESSDRYYDKFAYFSIPRMIGQNALDQL
ncbi:MAG: DUF4173 domain-containing protein [Oscillospiraceae bacterium]|nr:DUF4173 domain-containing protein [Oscillospiraceae bacterium]